MIPEEHIYREHLPWDLQRAGCGMKWAKLLSSGHPLIAQWNRHTLSTHVSALKCALLYLTNKSEDWISRIEPGASCVDKYL